MQNNERTWSRRATTIPHHRHQSWNNIEMLEVNTGDWLSFTVAPARERSLSPCSGIDHDVKQVELAGISAYIETWRVEFQRVNRIDDCIESGYRLTISQ